ncbi:hypothetical protein [Mycobacterium leprae]|uniref:hypothetical protein n=1 Tax=Mycobacterium leprae TaxID=1769 RepID=UPI001E2F561C|nr:hypothetical protein [Mycobacterium leprae]
MSYAGARVELVRETALPDSQPYVTHHFRHTDAAALFYNSGTTGPPQRGVDHPRGFPDQYREHDPMSLSVKGSR